ncbi:dihydrolipoyl dehydrogenase (plasmid) [Aliirhizobium terrae]|uniref:dihydrolipoyl dehydrogenase n=1 Tax=Terrirhizobium terrae TaxID=2926709 RepID=UPI002578AC5C|nr:dihydrolipoyl dehydrogenase [Rhizobium sp. CC-CFT758]WJH38494.1 dihydrolipoyl dehydrogenase [Rhizobium sp. CC-CFT758]
MSDRSCDVAIIGAGTAGLSAERSARRAGAQTLLIDDRFAGTTCASVGCMPSKLLIAASKKAHAIAGAAEFGVHAGTVEIDGQAVMRRVRKLRDAFVASTLKSLDDIPEGVRLKGKAYFVEPGVLAVDEDRVVAKAIVVATGSRTAIPKPFEGLGHVLTNETVFELADLPVSLAVIGAGPLGLELAQAFARLGVDVEVFDEGNTIAALKDEAVVNSLRPLLEAEFHLRLGTTVSASQVGNEIEVSWSGASSGKRRFSHVLAAAGRPPNVEGLALEKAGLELDEHGVPVFDRTTMQCGSSPIFLAGDCDHDAPVLHEASAEGAIAGHNAARFPAVKPSKRSTPLAITFTDPPSASIGEPADDDSIVGETDFSDQGRAKVDGRNAGLVRLYADKSGKLTGGTLAAPEAEHLAHLIAWAIEHGQTAMHLLELPIYHPTYEEGLRTALRQICQRIDVGFAADRDAGSAPGV